MMALFDEETIQKAYGKEKYDEGKAEGENLLAMLMQKLYEDGREDDARRAVTDASFRNQQYKAFGLV